MTASDDQPGGMIFQERLELPVPQNTTEIHSCLKNLSDFLAILDLSCTCSGQSNLLLSKSPCHIVVLFDDGFQRQPPSTTPGLQEQSEAE